jgi:hypothetical protein
MECPTAEIQENSAIPQPIETAIVTHGVSTYSNTTISFIADQPQKEFMACRRPT